MKEKKSEGKDQGKSNRKRGKLVKQKRFNALKPSELRGSGASEQMQAIIQLIIDNELECSICSCSIGRRGRIWSCPCCHIILHHSCVDKWYQSQQQHQRPQHAPASDADAAGAEWRCPGCMYVFTESPAPYACFCGKVPSPEPNPYLTPHSCGNVCGKKRGKNCDHPCTLQCHPGFCPPCGALGPERHCPCGKTTYRLRCAQDDEKAPEKVQTCASVCGKSLPCGQHTCQSTCHVGPCDPCPIKVARSCFCGKHEAERPCGSNAQFEGRYSCQEPCEKKLSCHEHSCSKPCHPASEPCQSCVRLPVFPGRCACARHTEASLRDERKAKMRRGERVPSVTNSVSWNRDKCTDPLPSCGEVCGRLLSCGMHTCPKICHDSPCGPCEQKVEVACRCGRSEVSLPCADYVARQASPQPQPVTCERLCKRQMSCRRHKCNVTCCPFDIDNGNGGGDRLAHVCDRVCNRLLECGEHRCPNFCHLGFCPPCKVIYPEGIPCACGAQRTPPGAKCGTPVPPCSQPCSRPRDCPHACPYRCHKDECPPCAVLTSRVCAGGHMMLHSIPCYVSPGVSSCGALCNKPLACGQHNCQRTCHAGKCSDKNFVLPVTKVSFPMGRRERKRGEEKQEQERKQEQEKEKEKEEISEEEEVAVSPFEPVPCGQICGQPRQHCSHVCQAKCHVGSSCPSLPCNQPVEISCRCGRMTSKVPCGIQTGDDARQLRDRHLDCNDRCEIERRNAAFRDAFNVSSASASSASSSSTEPRSLFIPYPSALLDQLIALKLSSSLLRIEDTLSEFIEAGEESRFLPPMSQHQRWLVHQMSSYYNLVSTSYDREPKRSVRIMQNEEMGGIVPRMLMSQALKLYMNAIQPSSSSSSSSSSSAATATTTPSVRTIDPHCILHFRQLDCTPRVSIDELRQCLLPWEGQYRLTALSYEHAIAAFTSASAAQEAKQRLQSKSLFQAAPPVLETEINTLVPVLSSEPSSSATSRRKVVEVDEDGWTMVSVQHVPRAAIHGHPSRPVSTVWDDDNEHEAGTGTEGKATNDQKDKADSDSVSQTSKEGEWEQVDVSASSSSASASVSSSAPSSTSSVYRPPAARGERPRFFNGKSSASSASSSASSSAPPSSVLMGKARQLAEKEKERRQAHLEAAKNPFAMLLDEEEDQEEEQDD